MLMCAQAPQASGAPSHSLAIPTFQPAYAPQVAGSVYQQ